jgi:hypothetical protein
LIEAVQPQLKKVGINLDIELVEHHDVSRADPKDLRRSFTTGRGFQWRTST